MARPDSRGCGPTICHDRYENVQLGLEAVRSARVARHLSVPECRSARGLVAKLRRWHRRPALQPHDERLLPLADHVVELTPRSIADDRPPERSELAPGEPLFTQGDTGTLVYEVDRGSIEIARELADGGIEVLAIVEPPGYFGELAAMFGLRRSASARAGARGAVVTGYNLREFRERLGRERSGGLPGQR